MRNGRYSLVMRRAAVDLYVRVGPAEAGRRLGVAPGTVAQWARRARLSRGGEYSDGSAGTAAATAAAAAKRAVARRGRIDAAAELRHLDEAFLLLAALDAARDARSYLRLVRRVGHEVDAARVARGGVRG